MKIFKYHTEHRTILGDLHTPVSVYMKVRDLFPQSILMESSDYHNTESNRSFIGINPISSLHIQNGKVYAQYPDNNHYVHEITPTYTVRQAVEDYLSHFQTTGDYACYCGLYGYTSFDAVQYIEPISISKTATDTLPDAYYIIYKNVIVFDHNKNEITIIEMCGDSENSKTDYIEQAIENRNYSLFDFRTTGPATSVLNDAEHKANIRKGISHCMRGDVFQIVISRRFMQTFEGDDFKLYRALRSINPSPYLFYFDFGTFRIFGSSPETHCKIEKSIAYIDPIAGTAPRCGDKETDIRTANALLADQKENAEHVMLVDLARNDLSRNCYDTHVEVFKEIQYYSHVIHLVSRVKGTLSENTSRIGTFLDTFPAGTLSGAPKVRAMQLISEIEPHNRGIYGGCVGFIGLDGSVNQAITIRSFVSRNNCLVFQAGGGITALSNEENELQEVNNKLAALRKAIAIAENY